MFDPLWKALTWIGGLITGGGALMAQDAGDTSTATKIGAGGIAVVAAAALARFFDGYWANEKDKRRWEDMIKKMTEQDVTIAQLREENRVFRENMDTGQRNMKKRADDLEGKVAQAKLKAASAIGKVEGVQYRLQKSTYFPPGKAAAAIRGSDPSRILIVEDDAEIVRKLSAFLTSEGFIVDSSATAEEAMKALEKKPAWVILDIALADSPTGGLEVLRKIRDSTNLVKVIVATGSPKGSESMDEIDQLGPDAIFGKPVDVRRLVEVLQGRRPLQEEASESEK